MKWKNTEEISIEDLYWLMITKIPEEKKKPFDMKEYNKKYYQLHKGYCKSKTIFHRAQKKKAAVKN